MVVEKSNEAANIHEQAKSPNLYSLHLVLDVPPEEYKKEYFSNSWILGPFLQGVLMERVDTVYAEYLHNQPFNPYSQHCSVKSGNLVWTISTLNDEAGSHLLKNLIEPEPPELFIRTKQLHCKVAKRKLTQIKQSDLTNIFYDKDVFETGQTRLDSKKVKPSVTINFDTPTAFKSNGRYIFYPDIRLLFQNLSMRYSALYESNKEPDDELLELLVRNSKITSFQLKSQYFILGNSKIPAFMGRVTIKLYGPESLNNYARMLLKFGEFSGVGIKCSMGMGALSAAEPSIGKARR